MKKQFLLLLIAAVFSGQVQAQKGRSGVGVDFGAVGLAHVMGKYECQTLTIGLKYNYGISNMFEVEPWMTFYPYTIDVNYGNYYNYYYSYSSYRNYSPNKDFKYVFSGGVNLKTYFFKTRFRPFLLTGAAMHVVRWPEYTFEQSDYYDLGTFVAGNTVVAGGKKGTKIAFRGGIGFDYRLSYHSYLQLTGFFDTTTNIGLHLTYVYKF